MKKNVIALAVAAAMTAPLAAQAEVTVSGQLQAEISSLSGDNVVEGIYMHDAQEGGVPNKGNFGALNFSATEDLGGGLKAIAKYGINVDVDGRDPAQRDSYIGLSGGFGTILAGTMSSPYKSSTVKWDPFLATAGQARGNYGMSGLHNGYVGNALAYANKFGMVKVVAAVVFDEAADDEDPSETSGDHATSFSVNVPVGPVEIAAAYIDMTDYGTNPSTTTTTLTVDPLTGDVTNINIQQSPATETGDMSAVKAGVKYAAGPISVAAQYEDIDVGAPDNITHAYVNGAFTAGANTFAVAYGQQDDGVTTPTQITAGMIHNFSKTTSAHVAYTSLDHDNDTDDAGVTVGMRVKF